MHWWEDSKYFHQHIRIQKFPPQFAYTRSGYKRFGDEQITKGGIIKKAAVLIVAVMMFLLGRGSDAISDKMENFYSALPAMEISIANYGVDEAESVYEKISNGNTYVQYKHWSDPISDTHSVSGKIEVWEDQATTYLVAKVSGELRVVTVHWTDDPIPTSDG